MRAGIDRPSRIVIERPAPVLDCGRHPVKRTTGDTVAVSADIFRDGHDVLRAAVLWRGPGDGDGWHEAPLTPVDAHHRGVRWEPVLDTALSIGRRRHRALKGGQTYKLEGRSLALFRLARRLTRGLPPRHGAG